MTVADRESGRAGPRLILFDVDGTLVETAGAGRRAFAEAFRRLLGDDGIDDAVGNVPFQGKTDPIIIEEIVREIGVGAEEFSRYEDRFWKLYPDVLRELLRASRDGLRVLPGIPAVLDELDRRAGVYLGLQTGNIEIGARAKLEALGLGRYFPGGGFASDHRDRREIVRLAREKLSRHYGIEFSAEATVVVGDTAHDIESARANRHRAVAVDHGWVPREELEAARPDALLDDFTDLASVLEALGVPVD